MPPTPPARADADAARILWLWAAGAIGLWWAGLLLGPLALGGLGLTAFVAFRAARERRWAVLAATLALLPPTIFGALAAVDYARGEARLLVERGPHMTLHNIDPTTRSPSESRPDSTWVRRFPHNATLRGLTALLGPMPGAYAGPYPTPAEARGALADGVSWSGATPPAGAPKLPQAIEQMLHAMARDGVEIEAASWREQVGIIRVARTAAHVGPGPGAKTTAMILFDQETDRVLAYRDAVAILGAGLPAPWR